MEVRAEIGAVASILLVAFLLAFYQSGEAEAQSYAALRLRILTLGQTITARCGPVLTTGDYVALQPLVVETVAQPDMISVVIFDGQGRPVASAGRVDPATKGHVGRALMARFQQSNAASYETHPDAAGDQFVYLPVRDRVASGASAAAGGRRADPRAGSTGRLLGAIELGVSHVPTILMLQEAWLITLLYTLLVALVVALVCARVVGRIVRPLAAQYEATLESRQEEKMTAVGQLGAGIAHEINNPLTAILGYAQIMLQDMQLDTLVRKRVEIIEREARRCSEIVQMLFAYSQPSGQNREAADLRPIIERAVELIRPQAASQNVTVRCRFNDAVPPLLLNAREIQLVATNILTNALDVMPRGGRTTVHCEASERDRLLTLTIADTGPGIPEENLRRVFEPFFTTKENWRSTGLGLTVCYKVIHDHGGRIRARNRPEGGAEFVIELPLPPKQAARLA